MTYDHWKTTNPDDEFLDGYEDYDECENCGGEGVIYMCRSEYACIDPEGGCDLCARRCDWCGGKG